MTKKRYDQFGHTVFSYCLLPVKPYHPRQTRLADRRTEGSPTPILQQRIGLALQSCGHLNCKTVLPFCEVIGHVIPERRCNLDAKTLTVEEYLYSLRRIGNLQN